MIERYTGYISSRILEAQPTPISALLAQRNLILATTGAKQTTIELPFFHSFPVLSYRGRPIVYRVDGGGGGAPGFFTPVVSYAPRPGLPFRMFRSVIACLNSKHYDLFLSGIEESGTYCTTGSACMYQAAW